MVQALLNHIRSSSAPSGGTLAIERYADMQLDCAPLRVAMRPDLSGTTFDNTDVTDAVRSVVFSGNYKPSLHNIIYIWDTGETDDYSTPDNLPSGWESKQYKTGPAIIHVYHNPGTYSARVYAYEVSSGKVAVSDTITITVTDPVGVYDRIVAVNPNGDSDFSWRPTGGTATYYEETLAAGNVFNKNTSAYTAHDQETSVLWLMKPGATFNEVEFEPAGPGRNKGLGSHGYTFGTRPILNRVASDADDSPVINGNSAQAEPIADLRIYGLDIRGAFDPETTENYNQTTMDQSKKHGISVKGARPWDLVISECFVGGFRGASANLQGTTGSRYFFSDCEATDRGGHYGIITNPNPDANSLFGLAGCKLHDTPLTVADNPPVQRRAWIRCNGIETEYYSQNEFFFTTQGQQAIGKIMAYNTNPGGVCTMSRCVGEGGAFLFDTQNNVGGVGGSVVMNGVVESCIYIAGSHAVNAGKIRGQGLTVRNNHFIVPAFTGTNADTPTAVPFLRFFDLDDSVGELTPGDDGGIQIYNNTLVNLRTTTQNGGEADSEISSASIPATFAYVDVENNVHHAPNITNAVTTHAPLTSATLATATGNVQARATASVVSSDAILADPPVSPENDRQYLVASSGATGAWVGQENNLAHWTGSSWTFAAPDDGWVLYDFPSQTRLEWNGSAWVTYTGTANAFNVAGDIEIFTPSTGSSAIDGASGDFQAGLNFDLETRPSVKNIGAEDDGTPISFD